MDLLCNSANVSDLGDTNELAGRTSCIIALQSLVRVSVVNTQHIGRPVPRTYNALPFLSYPCDSAIGVSLNDGTSFRRDTS
jgi:hypothetical protein